MIKIKHFVLLLPLLVVFAATVYQVGQKKITSGDNKNNFLRRTIASQEVSTNLAISFKKVNDQGKVENFNEISAPPIEGTQQASDDLNYLKDHYFSKDKTIREISFEQQYQNIQTRISQNTKLYNEILGSKLEDALLANDEKHIAELFALGASLPIGPSSIHYLSEKILIDLATGDRKWNDSLFRNILQFYYVQNLIKNQNGDRLITHLLEVCPDEKLKENLLLISREINIYTKNKEDEK